MLRAMVNSREPLTWILIGLSMFGSINGSGEVSPTEECNMSLDLTAVGLKSLPNRFVKHKFLTKLTLDENEIESVSSEAFLSVPKLSHLSLARNKLTSLNLHPYSALQNLDTLILNGNCNARITTQTTTEPSPKLISPFLSDWYDDRFGLSTASPDYTVEQTVTEEYETTSLVYKDDVTKLGYDEHDFCSLQIDSFLWSLTHLFLEDNHIKYLSFISGRLPALTHLHLSNNPLEPDLKSIYDLNGIAPALTHLYLQNCTISGFHVSLLPKITSLYLDNNAIKSICCHYYCLTSSLNLYGARKLEILSVSSNEISKIDVNSFFDTRNLLTLDLSRNKISEIKKETFDYLYRLRSLSLDRNQLLQLSAVDTFKDLINLETLSLGGTDMSKMTSGIFSNLSSLKKLMLNCTKISSIESEIFSNLTSLAVLSLAGNQLSSIPTGFLSASGLLTTLDLDNNQFTSTNYISLTNVPNMLSLSLKDNPLTTMTAKWITNIRAENLTITLGRSPPGRLFQIHSTPLGHSFI